MRRSLRILLGILCTAISITAYSQDIPGKVRPKVGLVLSSVNLINCLEGILCPCNFNHDISPSLSRFRATFRQSCGDTTSTER